MIYNLQLKGMNGVKRTLIDFYAIIMGRRLFAAINSFFFKIGSVGLGMYHNKNCEYNLLKNKLRSLNFPVIFDVGANRGNYIQDILNVNRNSIIHAFEPNSDLCDLLKNKYNDIQNRITINSCAVGSVKGKLKLYDYALNKGTEHATLVDGVINNLHKGSQSYVEVEVVTLDEYCTLRDIKLIDFMKIDVEGFEYEVLTGARNLLEKRIIKKIQFEFNEMNVYSRRFFLDFYNLLSKDYNIFRLLPNGEALKINNYIPYKYELFVYQNIYCELK